MGISDYKQTHLRLRLRLLQWISLIAMTDIGNYIISISVIAINHIAIRDKVERHFLPCLCTRVW